MLVGKESDMTISADEHERVRSDVKINLNELLSSCARRREEACAKLGDFFEYYIGRGGYGRDIGKIAAFKSEIREAVAGLIEVAVGDQVPAVVEASLHALECAVNFADAEKGINWGKLAGNLDRYTHYSDVCTALYCLANTGEPEYRPTIANLLQHSRPEIRAAAAEHLELLDKYINIAAGRDALAAGRSETQALDLAKADVPHFLPSCVILGYYVREYEMGDRGGAAWQAYREALKRLRLPETFGPATKVSTDP